MKRTLLFATLLSISALVSAQSMKVQSAYSDMKNGRLLNAKQNIDDACKDDKTSQEAKTWNYAGVIYTQIVQAMEEENVDKKTRKELSKISESKEELCAKGMSYLKKCLEMDDKHEYTSSSIGAMKVLCGFAFMYAGNDYNNQKYAEAAKKFEDLAKDAAAAQHLDIVLDAKFYEADCQRMLKNSDKELELYRELAKLNSPKGEVYVKIYAANMNAKDTVKAINALKKGVKLTGKDKAMNIKLRTTLAQTYIWQGNNAEADKIIAELLEKETNNVVALNNVANIYVDLGNAAKAEELFNKSLAIDNKQIEPSKGMGLLYYNKGVDENAAAEKLPPDPEFDAEYNAHKLASFDNFALAEPFFVKVLQIKEDDFESLKALKTIYSQLPSRPGTTPEAKAGLKEKYQQVSAKLSTLVQ